MKVSTFLRRQIDSMIYGFIGPFAVLYVFPKFFLSIEKQLQFRAEGLETVKYIGIVSMNLGGVLAIWCTIIMYFSKKASPSPFSIPQKVVSNGPFKIVRHPMMWALHITLLGEVLTWFSPFLFIWFLIWIRFSAIYIAKLEEPYLIHIFGQKYIDYCKQVPRWLPKKRRKINFED